jgi:hypothetical protein
MANHPNRSKQCRPREYLRSLGKTYPDAWKLFEEPRQSRGKDGAPNWPAWCYCPLSNTADIIQRFVEAEKVSVDKIWDIGILGALAAWRVGQGIYRFDPDLFESIIDTPINQLPVDVLFHLPEWCVYIETPNLLWFSHKLAGFFVHLEWDVKSERPELRLLLDIDEEEHEDSVRRNLGEASTQYNNLVALPIHLTTPTLDLAIEAMIEEAKKQGMVEPSAPDLSKELARSLEPVINLTLYLCTANADFGVGERPTYPRPTKTKKGWRLFPPDRPRTWAIGVRIGSALREAKLARQADQRANPLTETGRSRPGPHIRRSHWHTYRVGEGRTESILKWLPPIPINVDNPDALPVSLHSVLSPDPKEGTTK